MNLPVHAREHQESLTAEKIRIEQLKLNAITEKYKRQAIKDKKLKKEKAHKKELEDFKGILKNKKIKREGRSKLKGLVKE